MAGEEQTNRERDLRVAVGTHVEIELIDENGVAEPLVVDLVPDRAADLSHGFLGEGTPLAQAIQGHRAGEVVPYRAGDIIEVRILRVTPSATRPAEDAEARRQAVIQEAVARSEALNDAAFALAAGSKWGAYDPAAIPGETQEPKPRRKHRTRPASPDKAAQPRRRRKKTPPSEPG